jgi:hypothetical protein
MEEFLNFSLLFSEIFGLDIGEYHNQALDYKTPAQVYGAKS